MRTRNEKLAALPVFVPVLATLLAATLAFAGDVCLDQTEFLPCPPWDIACDPNWIGFSTDASGCEQLGYPDCVRLTLSASATDPWATAGEWPSSGRLYLWNSDGYTGVTRTDYGWGSLHVMLVTDFPIVAYEPLAPGNHQWHQDSLSLSFWTCEPSSEPAAIGAFVLGTTAVESESWGSIKALWR